MVCSYSPAFKTIPHHAPISKGAGSAPVFFRATRHAEVFGVFATHGAIKAQVIVGRSRFRKLMLSCPQGAAVPRYSLMVQG